MILNSKTTAPSTQPGQPKKRSLFSTLFIPRLGPSISMLGQSMGMFVTLVALVFASNGLFPKDHPALRGDTSKGRLRLSNVISTAYASLSFTKEGLPRVLLFAAVMGALLCSALAGITALLLLFTSQAHAQQSFFTPPSPNDDIAYNLLDYLFMPDKTASAFSNLSAQYSALTKGGILPNQNLQYALWAALGYYSNALMVFAGIILFYHLAMMVIETAHTGVPMGKRASQVWAPIRLAAAVVLLVPISAQLNAGQYMVVSVAKWGSALASNVWEIFRENLNKNGGTVVPPPTPGVEDIVYNVALMAGCEIKVNYDRYKDASASSVFSPTGGNNRFVVGWTNNWTDTTPWNFYATPKTPDWLGTAPPMVVTNDDGSVTYHFQPYQVMEVGEDDLCGSYTIPAPPAYADPTHQRIAQGIYDAHVNTFNAMLPSIMSYGMNMYSYINDANNPYLGDLKLNITGVALINLVYSYQSLLDKAVLAAMGNINSNLDNNGERGWLMAGGRFTAASSQQGIALASSYKFLPKTQKPLTFVDLYDYPVDVKNSLSKPPIGVLPPIVRGGGGGCPPPNVLNLNYIGKFMSDIGTHLWNGDLLGIILIVINEAGGQTGVWCSDGSLGVHFSGYSPMNQIAAWGHSNLQFGTDLMNWGLWFIATGLISTQEILGISVQFFALGGAAGAVSAAGQATGYSWIASKILGEGNSISSYLDKLTSKLGKITLVLAVAGALGPGAIMLGGMLLGFAALFFTIGVSFGYIVPLIPFMFFFFAAISWLTVVFEAIVAMPLVALAHINPEGEGLPGQQARGAYFMIFSIFLRPVAMIFALIIGLITISLAVSLLNMLFSSALGLSGGALNDGRAVITKIIFTTIYVVIIASVANNAFELIRVIPDKMMQWIGAQGATPHAMGNPDSIQNKATLMTGYLSSRPAGFINQNANQLKGWLEGAKGLGSKDARNQGQGFLGGHKTKDKLRDDYADSLASKALSADRHNQLHEQGAFQSDVLRDIRDGMAGGGNTPPAGGPNTPPPPAGGPNMPPPSPTSGSPGPMSQGSAGSGTYSATPGAGNANAGGSGAAGSFAQGNYGQQNTSYQQAGTSQTPTSMPSAGTPAPHAASGDGADKLGKAVEGVQKDLNDLRNRVEKTETGNKGGGSGSNGNNGGNMV